MYSLNIDSNDNVYLLKIILKPKHYNLRYEKIKFSIKTYLGGRHFFGGNKTFKGHQKATKRPPKDHQKIIERPPKDHQNAI